MVRYGVKSVETDGVLIEEILITDRIDWKIFFELLKTILQMKLDNLETILRRGKLRDSHARFASWISQVISSGGVHANTSSATLVYLRWCKRIYAHQM